MERSGHVELSARRDVLQTGVSPDNQFHSVGVAQCLKSCCSLAAESEPFLLVFARGSLMPARDMSICKLISHYGPIAASEAQLVL